MILQGSIGQFYQSMMENKSDALKILLIASCLFLLPVGRAVELSVLIMAILGIKQLIQEGRGVFVHKSYYYFTFLFLAFWIPMLIALLDAVNFNASAKTTLLYVRFYFAGIFIISVLRNQDFMDRYLTIISAIVGFIVIDASIQIVTGIDLFGYDSEALGRINGLFGDDLKLGIILAVFSPILLETILQIRRKVIRYILLFVTYELILAIILLSISRASLVMFAVVTIGYVSVFFIRNQKNMALIGIVLIMSTVTIGYNISESVKARISPVIDIFQSQWATDSDEIVESKSMANLKYKLNMALSERAHIWETAFNILSENYFNGIGSRGFRYTYREYASPDDVFTSHPNGIVPTHPHQYIVEVLVETGIIGLVGLILFFIKGSQIMVEAWRDRNMYIYAPAISVLACLFPINTTLSIYSSFWGQIVWLFIALFCASVGMRYRH